MYASRSPPVIPSFRDISSICATCCKCIKGPFNIDHQLPLASRCASIQTTYTHIARAAAAVACGTTLCPNMKTPFTYTYCTVRTSSQTTKWRRSLLVDETRLDSLLILTWCVTNLIPQRTNTDRILFFSLSSRGLNKRFHCWEEKGKLLTTYIITLASYSYCTHLRDYLHLY